MTYDRALAILREFDKNVEISSERIISEDNFSWPKEHEGETVIVIRGRFPLKVMQALVTVVEKMQYARL